MRRLLFCLVLLVPSVADAQDFRFRQNIRYRESYRGGRAFAPVGGLYGYPAVPLYGTTVYGLPGQVLVLPQAVEIRETVIQPAPVYRTETTTTTTYGPYYP